MLLSKTVSRKLLVESARCMLVSEYSFRIPDKGK
jgi:hypothetical protein